MKLMHLFESNNPVKKIVCIIPGGYHPPHLGHKSLYNSALKMFPGADIYYAATNDQKLRPFAFDDKKVLATLAGFDPKKFIQVKSPFRADEIVQKYDPNITAVVFIRSDKDKSTPPIPGGTLKNGNPSYLQPISKTLKPLSKHGYIAYLPTIEFKAGKAGMSSATQIRNKWPKANTATKQKIAQDLYPKNPAKAIEILDRNLSEIDEAAGVGVVKNSKDPRYVMSTTCDVKGNTLNKELKAFGLAESPDFGYSTFNNKENKIKQLKWDIETTSDFIQIRAYLPNKKNKNSSMYGDYEGIILASINKARKAIQINFVSIKAGQDSKEWYGTGLGQLMYEKLIEFAKSVPEIKYVDSDITLTPSASAAWKKLAQRYPVTIIRKNNDSYYRITLTKETIKEDKAPVIQFHDKLNPKFWDGSKLKSDVARHLKATSAYLIQDFDLEDLEIVDVTISGSNTAYTYTPTSDIDLHIVIHIDNNDEELMQKYLAAKGKLFNTVHDIELHGAPLEAYIQLDNELHVSNGLYSLLKNKWIDVPKKIKASINETTVKAKYNKIVKRIKQVIKNQDLEAAKTLAKKISAYRRAGLAESGEFGCENLCFKMLRNKKWLDKLADFRINYVDKKLSMESQSA